MGKRRQTLACLVIMVVRSQPRRSYPEHYAHVLAIYHSHYYCRLAVASELYYIRFDTYSAFLFCVIWHAPLNTCRYRSDPGNWPPLRKVRSCRKPSSGCHGAQVGSERSKRRRKGKRAGQWAECQQSGQRGISQSQYAPDNKLLSTLAVDRQAQHCFPQHARLVFSDAVLGGPK
jgi:hypothetical protein